MQALGQRLLHLLEGCCEAVVGLLGVGASQLEGHEGDGGLAVELTAVAVVGLPQLDIGDVLQTENGAVGLGHDDDVLELLDLFQTAGVAQLVLVDVVNGVAVTAFHRLLAQLADSGFEVLLGQTAGDVRGHEAVLCHHLGLQPDAQ